MIYFTRVNRTSENVSAISVAFALIAAGCFESIAILAAALIKRVSDAYDGPSLHIKKS